MATLSESEKGVRRRDSFTSAQKADAASESRVTHVSFLPLFSSVSVGDAAGEIMARTKSKRFRKTLGLCLPKLTFSFCSSKDPHPSDSVQRSRKWSAEDRRIRMPPCAATVVERFGPFPGFVTAVNPSMGVLIWTPKKQKPRTA
jgi:hypothetical protein